MMHHRRLEREPAIRPRFLSLPIELRFQIYNELGFLQFFDTGPKSHSADDYGEHDICLRWSCGDWHAGPGQYKDCTDLLRLARTCTTINKEIMNGVLDGQVTSAIIYLDPCEMSSGHHWSTYRPHPEKLQVDVSTLALVDFKLVRSVSLVLPQHDGAARLLMRAMRAMEYGRHLEFLKVTLCEGRHPFHVESVFDREVFERTMAQVWPLWRVRGKIRVSFVNKGINMTQLFEADGKVNDMVSFLVEREDSRQVSRRR